MSPEIHRGSSRGLGCGCGSSGHLRHEVGVEEHGELLLDEIEGLQDLVVHVLLLGLEIGLADLDVVVLSQVGQPEELELERAAQTAVGLQPEEDDDAEASDARKALANILSRALLPRRAENS